MEALISTNTPTREFEKHLNIENNNRILFSGPFGIGKTTFINKFFSNKNKYVTITLRPINYTVASNEDIFRLIKYDILYQLLESEQVEVEDFGEFNELDIAKYFIHTQATEIIVPFIKYIPKIGATLDVAYKGLNKLVKIFNSFDTVKKNIQTNQEEKELLSFLANLEVEHYLLENDFITEIIKSTINKINSKKNQEEGGVILIIDDLDRIDPEHIFRLFNIFSTHFEYKKEADNKFEFHRVIFVCDLKNIQSIFQAKYGVSTDFNGYIDKFYSTKVFAYNNKEAIAKFIEDTLRNIGQNDLINQTDAFFLIEILTGMLEYEVTNLRNLQKIALINKKERVDILNSIKTHKVASFENFNFTRVANVLSYLVGSTSLLIEHLDKCMKINDKNITKDVSFKNYNVAQEKYMPNYLLPIYSYNQHKGRPGVKFHVYTKDNVSANRYILVDSGRFANVVSEEENQPTYPQGHIWYYLVESVKILKDYDVL
jgi:GTPase SAR1 family protein